MVGVIEDVGKAVDISFKEEGDVIAIIGKTLDDIGASEYLSFTMELCLEEYQSLI